MLIWFVVMFAFTVSFHEYPHQPIWYNQSFLTQIGCGLLLATWWNLTRWKVTGRLQEREVNLGSRQVGKVVMFGCVLALVLLLVLTSSWPSFSSAATTSSTLLSPTTDSAANESLQQRISQPTHHYWHRESSTSQGVYPPVGSPLLHPIYFQSTSSAGSTQSKSDPTKTLAVTILLQNVYMHWRIAVLFVSW